MAILAKRCPSRRLLQGAVTVTPKGEQNLGKPQTEQAVFGPYSNMDPPEYGKKC